MLREGDYVVYYTINGKTPPPALRLLDVVIDDSSEMLPEVKFIFENHDGRLEQPGLAQYLLTGNKIKFAYGYIGDISEFMEFEIQGHKGYEELTVITYPPSAIKDFPRARVFKKSKESDVAKVMATELGLKTDYIATTECIRSSIQQSNETNMKVIKRMGGDLNWEFGMQNGYLIFRPKVFDQEPEYYFTWRGQNIDGDILDFKPDMNIFQVPAAYKTVFVDPQTGKPEDIESNTDDTKRNLAGGSNSLISAGMGGNRAQPKIDGNQVKSPNVVTMNRVTATQVPSGKKTQWKATPTPTKRRTKPGERCLADDQFKRAEDTIFKAKLKVLGQPHLRSRIMLALLGLGLYYDGAWYLDRVVTKIGRGGFLCELHVIRNSSGKMAQVNAQKALAAQVYANQQPKSRTPGTTRGRGRGKHRARKNKRKVQAR